MIPAATRKPRAYPAVSAWWMPVSATLPRRAAGMGGAAGGGRGAGRGGAGLAGWSSGMRRSCRYPGGRPAITSFHKLVSSLRPALSLRRQGVEPRRPLPFAGRVHLLLHDIPAPPTMD